MQPNLIHLSGPTFVPGTILNIFIQHPYNIKSYITYLIRSQNTEIQHNNKRSLLREDITTLILDTIKILRT
jgi:hypothetical protein